MESFMDPRMKMDSQIMLRLEVLVASTLKREVLEEEIKEVQNLGKLQLETILIAIAMMQIKAASRMMKKLLKSNMILN
jgi:hypothetical protein